MGKVAQNKGFIVPLGKERDTYAHDKGIVIQNSHDEGSFWASGITINGEPSANEWGQKANGVEWKGIRTVMHRSDKVARKLWKGVSEEVGGLRCPFCHALCFKTDHPNIAVCGAAPGWFCFYERIADEKKTKTVLKIVNGELQEVTVEDEVKVL